MNNKITKGFSLIELMVVISIIAILAVAASSFLRADNYREEGQVDLMFDLIKVSRVTALQDRETVIICSSNDNTSCNTALPWQGSNVIAFISEDGTSVFDTDNDTLIANVETPSTDYYYDWSLSPNTFSNASSSSSSSSFILITSRGQGTDGVLTLCNQNTAYSRMLVNSLGSVSTEDPTNNTACTL